MVKATLQVWLSSESWDEKITLNNSGGPNVNTGPYEKEVVDIDTGHATVEADIGVTSIEEEERATKWRT